MCKCVVHGGWEVGGGLLNNVATILPGYSGELIARRLGFPQNEPIKDDKWENFSESKY